MEKKDRNQSGNSEKRQKKKMKNTGDRATGSEKQ